MAGIIPGIVDLIRGINERKRAARIDDAMENYFADPEATIELVMKEDPRFGIALNQQRINQAAAADKLGRERNAEAAQILGRYARGFQPGSDYGAALDAGAGFLKSQGVTDDQLAGFRGIVAQKGFDPAAYDDEAFKQMAKDRYTDTVATPGSYIRRGGQTVEKVPYAIKSVNTPAGGASTPFDPNTGRFITGDGATEGASGGGVDPSVLSVETLRPLFVAQESSGDYTAKNAETGALGRYQVMPATGRELARRIGVAWRPDMMTKDDAASRRYQDAIGDAAIQDSIDAGGGSPEAIFSHYYSGSPTAYQNAEGNPKTSRYVMEMMDRLGGGAGNGATVPSAANAGPARSPYGVTVPARPGKGATTYRTATPEELAGYPQGTAAQIDSNGKLVNIKTPTKGSSKDVAKLEQEGEQAQLLTDMLTRYVRTASQLRNHPGLKNAVGFLAGRVPGALLGQDAQDAINLLENLGDQTALSNLLAFKSASPSGAAGFGNLSNAEGTRLQNAFGSLSRTNSLEQLQENLDLAARDMASILKRQQAGFRRLEALRKGAEPQQNSAGGVRPGTVIRLPDGRTQVLTEQGWRDQ